MANNNQQLARNEGQPPSLKSILTSDAMKQQFAAALPKHLAPERFIRVALTALTRTPKLMECSQESFFKSLLDLSAIGLEPDGRKVHLIPYGRDCTVVVDYKGIVELVRRDSSVLDIQCLTIRENDECQWVNGEMRHVINPKQPRGEVVSTYTRIKWASGEVTIGEPFDKEDAERARRCSKSGSSGPWKDHYTEMWKKSNVKRDSKMWPLSPEVQDKLAKADEHEFSGDLRNVTPSMPTVPTADPFAPKAAITEHLAEQEAPAVDAEQVPLEEQPEQEW